MQAERAQARHRPQRHLTGKTRLHTEGAARQVLDWK